MPRVYRKTDRSPTEQVEIERIRATAPKSSRRPESESGRLITTQSFD